MHFICEKVDITLLGIIKKYVERYKGIIIISNPSLLVMSITFDLRKI